MRALITRTTGLAALLIAGGAMADTAFVAGPGLAIDLPDNDPAGASATLTVEGAGTIDSIDAVVVSMDHTWIGDLIVTLTAPDGTSVTLLDRPGEPVTGSFGNSADLTAGVGVIISDQIPSPGENLGNGGCIDIGGDCPRAGSPTDSLAGLSGVAADGEWTLTVTDNAGGDLGSIDGFIIYANTGGS